MKRLLITLGCALAAIIASFAQINTEKVMTIAQNALYFEDYLLSIQYFNQVINAKSYLSTPYFYRGLAKYNLDDFRGAEADCTESIARNPFVVRNYQVRGLARLRMGEYSKATADFRKALLYDPQNINIRHNISVC
ncbi:MAG: tetratricopeptide repeat protein, partial [Bacteroidaceae bacterium]